MKRFFYAMITTGKPDPDGLVHPHTGERSHWVSVRVFMSRTERNAWVKDQPRDYTMNADWQPARRGMIRRAHCGMTTKRFNRWLREIETSVND